MQYSNINVSNRIEFTVKLKHFISKNALRHNRCLETQTNEKLEMYLLITD